LLDRTRIINALPLATVKFHQLQFVEGTRMTDLYDAEPARFRRWTAAEYVDLTAEILRRLRPDIAVERIAGQTPPRIRCRRPWGNLRGDALWRMLEKRLVEKNAHQGEFFVSSQR
ncbi:MAG TPA: TIGR01212 family radical SAM protein, partial [Alistipes obesi]|nr:TIGR01212 family radical SAM protein [Alistipes communis]